MKDDVLDRRTFLKGAVAGSAAAVIGALPQPVPAQQDVSAPAQQDAPAPAQQGATAPAQPATSVGYSYLNLQEQAFVEALVDHMVPADELTPKGTDLGLNIFIDRALSGSWGKGDRLYMQGPWNPVSRVRAISFRSRPPRCTARASPPPTGIA
jgi:gluconate 2-dehydrogenase gamma chain